MKDDQHLSGSAPGERHAQHDQPHPKLKELGTRLLGLWRMHGETVEGSISFEWMEGGLFLVQFFDLMRLGTPQKGLEYIGWNESTQTLRSRRFGTDGTHSTYTWEIQGPEITTWLGDPGSSKYSKGRFISEDRLEGSGHWPATDGRSAGYHYILERR
jgi:hypothetical protein